MSQRPAARAPRRLSRAPGEPEQAAKAIREGKNLEALVAEILEAAP